MEKNKKMKFTLKDIVELFWNKQIHTLVTLLTFLLVSVNFILPEMQGSFGFYPYLILMTIIVISGVTNNLMEVFDL